MALSLPWIASRLVFQQDKLNQIYILLHIKLLHLYIQLCAFETKGLVKNIQLGNRCVNRQRKEWRETTVCKSWPFFVRHPLQCPPGFWICCTLALTEQQAGQAPPVFSLLSHLPHLCPSHHWSRRTPALVSSPRGIVTYGNALGIRQMSGQNSWHKLRMRSVHVICHINYSLPKHLCHGFVYSSAILTSIVIKTVTQNT